MASVSYQVARTGLSENALAAGVQTVTEGAAAPTTANNVEVRVDLAAGWTRLEVEEALDRIARFLLSSFTSGTIPL